MLPFILPSPIQEINLDVLSIKEIRLFIKREDLIHPWLSGNKYRKLKYNLLEAESLKNDTIITFGGVFSNHLFATAGACSLYGLKSTGIVRGEIDLENPTLKFCISKGMELIPIPRSEYRNKNDSAVVKDIIQDYDNAYLIPEGGTNKFAITGVTELMTELHQQMSNHPDFIVLPSGTGGTTAGLLASENLKSHIISFSSLKTDHLQTEILSLIGSKNASALSVNSDYHFGGYARWNHKLLNFISDFEKKTGIHLDHVYNGKALFGLIDLIGKDYFAKGATICYIHTGGIQGKDALNYMMLKQNKKKALDNQELRLK